MPPTSEQLRDLWRRTGAAEQLRDVWRRTGADLPGGDPRPSHGAEMEGYFWRITDVARGTVVLALCGVNRDGDGSRWATVAVSAHPAGVTRSAVVEEATDDPHHLDVRAGTTLRASADRLVVELDDVALDVTHPPGPARASSPAAVWPASSPASASTGTRTSSVRRRPGG